MDNKTGIKRSLILVIIIILPNAAAAFLQAAKANFEKEGAAASSYLSLMAIYRIILAVLMICLILTELNFIKKDDLASARLIPAGLTINLTANAIPLLFNLSVPMVLSYTYLTNMYFYAVLISLVFVTISILVFGGKMK